MKELILLHLKNVQSVLDDIIYPLKEKNDLGDFNFYWDVLTFINWMKENEPEDYEDYELESCLQILDEFGDAYVKVIEPARLKLIYRHNDGILNIDVAIQVMIKQFYDYVINLQESELALIKPESKSFMPSLKDIMDELIAFKADVRTALTIDTSGLAKEVLREVFNPVNTQKKLTKKEQFDADVAKGVEEYKLKMIRNAAKKQK